MHEGNEAGAGEWFRKLRDIGIAAVIVSDPALIMIAATEAPGLEIHLSTQASATNYETLEFWKELGLTRVFWRVRFQWKKLAEIRKRTDVEIEAFVHGAMCISYSGRCTLSNHMSMRDANRGWLLSVLSLEVQTFTICHLGRNVRVLKVKFLKNFQCQPLICP